MIYFNDKFKDIELIENFKLNEFICKCGKCPITIIDNNLVDLLYELRNKINNYVIITSGFRCYVYNKEIAGKPYSWHQLGKAIDISLKVPHKDSIIINAQRLFPYTYHKEDFIHCALGN